MLHIHLLFIKYSISFADQIGYITVQVEGNPAPTFKWYKVGKCDVFIQEINVLNASVVTVISVAEWRVIADKETSFLKLGSV
jgi:hypothetical protein